MIDVMILRQLYKGRKIEKIRRICSKDNPADAMTKVLPNLALEKMILTNKAIFRLEKWIKE